MKDGMNSNFYHFSYINITFSHIVFLILCGYCFLQKAKNNINVRLEEYQKELQHSSYKL